MTAEPERYSLIGRMWWKRFYDFNVCTGKKRVEKLRYMHRNPVGQGPASCSQEWNWSSFRAYLSREK